MTSEEPLATMRQQYAWATLETHMLVNGVLHLRCQRCKERPVPRGWFCVALCDPCLDIQAAEMARHAHGEHA